MAVASKSAQRPQISTSAKLWMAYLILLQTNPILTKSVTQLILSAGQESLAQTITGVKTYDVKRIAVLATYGFCISAPLSHYLFELMNNALSKTNSLVARVAFSNVVSLPIQVAVFVFFMSLLAGQSPDRALASAQSGTLPVLKRFWRIYPPVQLIVYKYLPQHLWMPFFQVFGFVMGTYLNVLTRRAAAAAAANAARRS